MSLTFEVFFSFGIFVNLEELIESLRNIFLQFYGVRKYKLQLRVYKDYFGKFFIVWNGSLIDLFLGFRKNQRLNSFCMGYSLIQSYLGGLRKISF